MAGNRIKGITVEIGGDTTKLQTALKGVNTEIRNTQSQLKDVEKLLKLDPGDVLTFAGGQADEGQITCITSIRQKIGGRQSLKCVGKNPRLAQAKSRNDKNISGLLNQIEDNAKTGKIGIHTFTNASVHEIGQTKQMTLFEAVELDFEKDLLYSITFGTSSVTITKIRIPVFNIGLNEKLDDTTCTVLEEQTLTTESFTFLGDYTKYGEFMDGHDGYWYGFSNEPNSSGDAKMVWIRISKKDYSFTEGSWTLSKAKLSEVGTRAKDGSYPERNVKCCVRKGYLYVPSYDKKGVYKINTANSADVTLIPLGFTSKLKSLGEAGSCEVYMTLLGDMIVAGDFQITADDRVIKTQGSARFEAMATPLFQYKNFVFMWGGSYGKEHRCAYLLTPYLASINNLSSAVVKNTDKTMKITYTLTEETM